MDRQLFMLVLIICHNYDDYSVNTKNFWEAL